MFALNSLRNCILGPLRYQACTSLILNGCSRNISSSSLLAFNLTPYLMAMPMKKKKHIDPKILKMREERKKRRIEKEMRQLGKMKKCLKPIEETRMPASLYNNMESRKREVEISENIAEQRILMQKEWSRIAHRKTFLDKKKIHQLVESQAIALEELHKESVELYNAAVQIDTNLIAFSWKGPTETPPIHDYDSPDGEYKDISKKWIEDVSDL